MSQWSEMLNYEVRGVHLKLGKFLENFQANFVKYRKLFPTFKIRKMARKYLKSSVEINKVNLKSSENSGENLKTSLMTSDRPSLGPHRMESGQ